MSTDQIPTDGLLFQWGRAKLILTKRAAYLALVLSACLAALYILKD